MGRTVNRFLDILPIVGSIPTYPQPERVHTFEFIKISINLLSRCETRGRKKGRTVDRFLDIYYRWFDSATTRQSKREEANKVKDSQCITIKTI